MGELLRWAATGAMLAVATHCLLKMVRPGRGAAASRPRPAHELLHVAMAVAMAAMFAGLVAGRWQGVLLVGFALAAAWLAVGAVRRRPDSGVPCLSSLAMAVMAWAMSQHTGTGQGSGQVPGVMSGVMAGHTMPGMTMSGATGAADPLSTALVVAALAVSLGLAGWALGRSRPRDAVMGGAMAVMLGSML